MAQEGRADKVVLPSRADAVLVNQAVEPSQTPATQRVGPRLRAMIGNRAGLLRMSLDLDLPNHRVVVANIY